MQQHQQVDAQPSPSPPAPPSMAAAPPYPSSSYSNFSQDYSSTSLNYAPQHPQYAPPHHPHYAPPSQPTGGYLAPSSPILSSEYASYGVSSASSSLAYSAGAGGSSPVPTTAAVAYGYAGTQENPSSAPSYGQYAAPDPAPYAPVAYSALDLSYSPRAPSLPPYERSSFDYAAGSSAAISSTPAGAAGPPNWGSGSYGAEYQLPRSTSYGGYAAVDGYSYDQAASKWGYEQVGEVPGSDGRSYGQISYGQQQHQQLDTQKPYMESMSNRSEFAGVYAYNGGSTQPYGSRGTSSPSWSSNSGNFNPLGELPKLVKALPKVESNTKGGGMQRYHVKVLQDSSSVGLPTNVICQIGLDGVRMLDPNTNRTLRIYPLETITKWEVTEPSVFTFWAKTAVDFEQRRTRLQSSASTTNAILDTLTAACVQVCEIVGKDGDSSKHSSASNSTPENQKKGSFADWLIKSRAPAEEEKEHWVPDEAVTSCTACGSDFGPFLRRHHCRNCGDIFCDKCTRGRIALTSEEDAQPVRVCDRCLAEVTQRITNVKDSSSKLVSQHTHEDLAKKLQEEMERNALRKTVSDGDGGSRSNEKSGQTSLLNCSKCGSISIVTGSNTRCPSCGTDSSGGRNGLNKKTSRLYPSSETSRRRTREVACPTCTVHLEVEVPSSGSETVECGVCQHPFLVSA